MEELSKSQTKFLSEYYLERDFTEGRFFDEALDSLVREEKRELNY